MGNTKEPRTMEEIQAEITRLEAKLAEQLIKNSSILHALSFNPKKLKQNILDGLDGLAGGLEGMAYAKEGYDKLKFIHFKDLNSWGVADHIGWKVDNIPRGSGRPIDHLVMKLKRMATDRQDGGCGDPKSIIPFLQSVVTGKMKVWDREGKRVKFRERRKFFELKEGESQIYYKNEGLGRDNEGAHYYKDGILIGHFRDDWRAWTLSEKEILQVKQFFNL